MHMKLGCDQSHSEILKEFEASHSRLSKRVKIQVQTCQQIMEEADKEYKKLSDLISENVEAIKSHQPLEVDAFTDSPFKGNPAAACLLEEARGKEWLQAVTREFNISETCYVTEIHNTNNKSDNNGSSNPKFSLRWFTPLLEHKSIDSVLARGEKLDSLVEKSSDLSATSQVYSARLTTPSIRSQGSPILQDSIVSQINSNPKAGWEAAMNPKFSNYTVAQFKHLLGVKPTPKKVLQGTPVVSPPGPLKLPKAFDARTAWSQCSTIGTILDQGHCGSC